MPTIVLARGTGSSEQMRIFRPLYAKKVATGNSGSKRETPSMVVALLNALSLAMVVALLNASSLAAEKFASAPAIIQARGTLHGGDNRRGATASLPQPAAGRCQKEEGVPLTPDREGD